MRLILLIVLGVMALMNLWQTWRYQKLWDANNDLIAADSRLTQAYENLKTVARASCVVTNGKMYWWDGTDLNEVTPTPTRPNGRKIKGVAR